MIYEVQVNGKTLYYPSNPEFSITNTTLQLDVGLAGTFKFDVPVTNLAYADVRQGAIITILKDKSEFWRGEVKETSVNIDKTMSVYALEDLAWLADEFLFPELDNESSYGQKFAEVIGAYNANRTTVPDRQFLVGNITNVNNADACKWATEYDWSILDSLRNCIAKDTGYLKVRRVTIGGVVSRYIDCAKLSDYGSVAPQPIRFGLNLLTYLEEMTCDNLTNVLTPYGAETDAEVYKDYTARLAGTVISDAASIASYGRHAKAVVFDTDDLTTLNNLAAAYLSRYSQPQITLKIDALDLAEISNNTPFKIGDSINVVAEPFAIDQNLYLTSQTLDLQDASKNNVTLSSYVRRTTSMTSQAVDTADLVKSLPTKSSVLDAARRNAYEILTGEAAGGGLVTFVTNSDNQITELRIANDLDIDNATECWVWNLGGLGYMSREYTTDPWTVETAMTMDGSINANFITTGTLNANAVTVNGKIQATSGYIGQNASNGWSIGSKGIYNGCTGMDSTATGLYVGTDGIRCNGNIGLIPGAWTKITGGTIDSAATITAGGFYARGGKASLGYNSVFAEEYNVNNGGNSYSGKTTGSFSFQAYVDGQYKTIGLNFMNGILVGISGF